MKHFWANQEQELSNQKQVPNSGAYQHSLVVYSSIAFNAASLQLHAFRYRALFTRDDCHLIFHYHLRGVDLRPDNFRKHRVANFQIIGV